MGVLAIGFFDGVHLGHQAILRGADGALTFRNHPREVLDPGRAPRLIMSVEDRIAAIEACGVGDVAVLDFTEELANMPPRMFAELLKRRLGDRLSAVRCGENWRFGKDGAGDADFLRAAGVDVEVVPYAEYKGEKISSSRIRACLEQGELEDASAMLGRRYAIRGTRVGGKGLGRTLGFPTVNLRLQTSGPQLNLPFGVYEVEMEGCRGIANYGLAPTMGTRAWKEPVLEVHLLYGQPSSSASASISVSLLRFLRPERKFDSLAELRRQIAEDCDSVLNGAGPNTQTTLVG